MVKIIVDSTADMTPEVAARVGIMPLTVHFGEKEYVSGVDIDGQKFYEMLVESASTSFSGRSRSSAARSFT